MKLRSSFVWIVVLVLSVSMASMAAQRGGGGRGGNRGNPQNQPNNNQQRDNNNDPRTGRGNLPPEGSTRQDTLRIQNKSRIMLEIVDMLQRRTGKPISYEDPLWAFEGATERGVDGKTVERPGEIKRTVPFQRDPKNPNPALKDILSLATGSFEFKILVDARSHLMQEPVDGSLGAALTAVLSEYAAKQLPGSFTHGYLGDVNDGGFGWIVLPDKFRARDGSWTAPRRVLDYPISFPLQERPTHDTFQLIAELVSKASGQQVQFKKLAAESNMTAGKTTEIKAVEIPKNQFVKIGATNETARSVIAKALRTIERGNPATQGPIPQRAWRLLYSIEKQTYYLDVVDVRQESYKIDGAATGSRPVNWPTSPSSVPEVAEKKAPPTP